MKKFHKLAKQRLGSETQAAVFSNEDSAYEISALIKRTDFTGEQVLFLFDEYKEISPRMIPLDKRQFQQLLDRIGTANVDHCYILTSYLTGIAKVVANIAYQTYADIDSQEQVHIHLSDSVVQKEIFKTLFNLYDRNGSGRIDFGEFILGTSVITTKNFALRAKGVFHLYDQNRDSVVSREDLLLTLRKSVKSARRIYNSSSKHLKEDIGKEKASLVGRHLDSMTEERTLQLMVEEIFQSIDTENKGFLVGSEFITYAEENPNTLRLFTQIAEGFEGFEALSSPRSKE